MYNTVKEVLEDARTRAQSIYACGSQQLGLGKDNEWLVAIDKLLETIPKPELCELLARDMPGVFLMNALSTHKTDSAEFCKLHAAYKERNSGSKDPYRSTIAVVLTVEGVQVPFWSTMMDIWGQIERMVDEKGKEKALKMVTAAGLEPLADLIQDLEEVIRDRFTKAGIELPRE